MSRTGSKCSAYHCESYHTFCSNLSFHRFPKVFASKKESYDRCNKWLINSRRTDLDDVFKKDPNYLNRNCRICSKHFKDSCYTNLALKILKNDAVPTEFDFPNQPPSSVSQKKPPKSRLTCMSPSPSNPQEENETIIGPSPEQVSGQESTKELATVKLFSLPEKKPPKRRHTCRPMSPSHSNPPEENETQTGTTPEKVSGQESTKELALVKNLEVNQQRRKILVFRLKNGAVPTKFGVLNQQPSSLPEKKPLNTSMSPSPSNPQEENETLSGPSPEKVSGKESTKELVTVKKLEGVVKQLSFKANQQHRKIFLLKNDAVSNKFYVLNQQPSSLPEKKPPTPRLTCTSPSPSNPQEENGTITGPSPEKISHPKYTKELAKIEKLEGIIKQLRFKANQRRRKIFGLNKTIASMRRNCKCNNYGSNKDAKPEEPNVNVPVIDFLKNQALLAKYKPRGRRYNEESKNLAITLYRCSPVAYECCRDILSLPSVRSLQKWLS